MGSRPRRGAGAALALALSLLAPSLLAPSLLAPLPAAAHSLGFGVLHVVEVPGGARVVLRVSGQEGRPPALELSAESGCALAAPPAREVTGAVLALRASLRCPRSLEGARLRVSGLAAEEISLAVRVERLDGPRPLRLLDPPAELVVLGARAASPLPRYLRLGAEHIAGGLDHLAFVLLLVLVVFGPSTPESGRGRRLLGAVTGFTLGHSITLSLAALGAVTVPSAPVEACIALSIVLLAAELLRDGEASLTRTRPWLVASAFGLLHGLGFAGALAELGLPSGQRVEALVGFNVGVELGQLAFVALLLAGGLMLTRARARVPHRAVAYAVGTVATVWTVARLSALL